MGTCAICLRPAPAGYRQCRDCIETWGVRENPRAVLERSGRAEPASPQVEPVFTLAVKFAEAYIARRDFGSGGLRHTDAPCAACKACEPYEQAEKAALAAYEAARPTPAEPAERLRPDCGSVNCPGDTNDDEPTPTDAERLRNTEEEREKYYVKARVYGAVARHHTVTLEQIARGTARPSETAREALAWCNSESNGVPMSAIEEMGALLTAQAERAAYRAILKRHGIHVEDCPEPPQALDRYIIGLQETIENLLDERETRYGEETTTDSRYSPMTEEIRRMVREELAASEERIAKAERMRRLCGL